MNVEARARKIILTEHPAERHSTLLQALDVILKEDDDDDTTAPR